MTPARPCLSRRRLLLATAGLALLTLLALSPRSAPAAAAPMSAQVVIKDLAEQAWQLLHRKDLDQRQRIDQLTQLLSSNTDVPLLSRLVLGRYWRELNESQQAGYEELFRAVVMRNLARRLDQYANGASGPLDQHFRVVGEQPAGGNDIMVRTKVLTEAGDNLNVDWRLRARDDRPVIIDMIVQGASLLVSQRSEFAAVIERSNVEGLLAELKARAQSSES
jgi:phospholipid transport system substrate-binding protein